MNEGQTYFDARHPGSFDFTLRPCGQIEPAGFEALRFERRAHLSQFGGIDAGVAAHLAQQQQRPEPRILRARGPDDRVQRTA